MQKLIRSILLCPKCNTLIRAGISIDTDITAEEVRQMIDLYCPSCGEKIPCKKDLSVLMTDMIETLNNKGYIVTRTIPKFFGIIFKKGYLTYEILQKLEQENKLPKEFTIDTTQPENDVIVNARLSDIDHGFDNYTDEEKAQYIVEAKNNLFNFILELPDISTEKPTSVDITLNVYI